MIAALCRRAILAAALLNVSAGLCQPPASPLDQARALLREGKLSEAESAARQYLVQNPSSADAHFLLGDVLFREKKPKESLAEFTAGAKFRRPQAKELRTVASDYILLDDFADADKWFTEVTAETPSDAEAWYLLGRTKYNENRFEEAIAIFQHVLALRPKDVRAEDNLGLSQQGLGHTEQAKTAFLTAIQWQNGMPTDAQPFLNLGTLLTDHGDPAAGVEQLQTAAKIAPENPKIREQLGRALQARGDLEGAQLQLENAVRLAPSAASLHYRLGQIYRQRGLKDRAQQEFSICARLNGTHSSTEVPNPFSPAAGRP
jgi:Flp pilus assembly protein TadD